MDPSRSSWNPETEQRNQLSRRQTEQPAISADVPERNVQRVGYGLPCASCKTYYPADLSACPYCGCPERVAPSSAPVPATELKNELETLRAEIADVLGQPTAGPVAETPPTAGERDRFLRQYKSQLYASHTQINPASAFRCSLEGNHQGAYEPAAICKSCYNQAAERLEQLEAALCVDI